MFDRARISQRGVRPSISPEVTTSMDAEPPVRERLLYFHEIPTWQQDNEYLASGYRPISGSLRMSYMGLFCLHNQTINILSHLLGSLAFCLLPFYFYENFLKAQPNARYCDLFVVTTYCLGVATCFAFSATHSLAAFWNKMDYLGILILMWGAGVPTIYFGFYCNPSLRLVYWTMGLIANQTSTTAVCCLIVTLHPCFIAPAFRMWRAGFYAGFGLSSLVFIIHGIIVMGWEVQKARMSLVWMSWMAVANLMGAAVYAARIPERWVPYRFDVFGASHQIFHVAVMVAAVVHFVGLTKAFQAVRLRSDVCHDHGF